MHPIIIVGSGLAGYTLAREIRKLDKQVPVTVITADDGTSYYKPALSNALSNKKDAMTLVLASAEKMAETLNLVTLTNTTVTGIDPETNTLESDQGSHEYSKLVLAVGAKPIVIPTPGTASDKILSINNLDDYRAFRESLKNRKHVAILGPGLIGCEFANDLAGNDYKVSVIGPDKLPLATILPEAASLGLMDALSSLGVSWYLETVAREINTAGSGYELVLSNGTTLEADLVLSAVGLKPDTGLAEAAGIKINRGIVVDRELRTSKRDIFAMGDCMEIDGQVLPFVMPITHCARSLASTLTGKQNILTFPAMPVVIKTPAYPLVTCPPHPRYREIWRLEVESDEQGVKACYYDDKQRLIGFTLSVAKISQKNSLAGNTPGYLD